MAASTTPQTPATHPVSVSASATTSTARLSPNHLCLLLWEVIRTRPCGRGGGATASCRSHPDPVAASVAAPTCSPLLRSMARKILKDGEALALVDGSEESYDYDLFVIGAGSGVVRGSHTAVGFGAKVAICELPFHPISSDWLGGHGGTCVIHGCLSKKILVHKSYILHHVAGKSFGCRTPRIFGVRSMGTSTTTGKSCWKTSTGQRARPTLAIGPPTLVCPSGITATPSPSDSERLQLCLVVVCAGCRARSRRWPRGRCAGSRRKRACRRRTTGPSGWSSPACSRF